MIGIVGLSVLLFALAYGFAKLSRKLMGEKVWGKLLHFRRSTR